MSSLPTRFATSGHRARNENDRPGTAAHGQACVGCQQLSAVLAEQISSEILRRLRIGLVTDDDAAGSKSADRPGRRRCQMLCGEATLRRRCLSVAILRAAFGFHRGKVSVMQKPPVAGMEHDSTGKLPQYPIESVDNALRLILLLGDRSEIRLTDASEYLQVASSTAHRLLSMLQYRGFVRQDPISRAYQPGPSLTNVAFAVHSRMDIPRTAAPILRHLAETLQETVHVGTLDGRLVRFIAALESPSAVRVISRLGTTRPAHCTSTGKVLLAGLSDDELDQLYPDPHLEPLTEHSVRTLTELRAQLAEVRKSGFATSNQESEEGVASVAVAVPVGGSQMRLALNASAPSYRFRPSDIRKARTALTDAAAELARNLG